MIQLLVVGAGGCCGAMARYWLTGVAHRWFGSGFPYGTLLVNVLGCLAFGGIWGLVEYRQLFSPNTRLFLTTGILGGLTTFSTFGYETFALLRDEEYALALTNIAANVAVGVVAVVAGWLAAKFLAT
jgi:fluoride exporter